MSPARSARGRADGALRSRVAPRDLIDEALIWIVRRRARSLLTALGTLLGVGAFVATLGLTSTAAAQISGRFDAYKATEVVIQDGRPDTLDPPYPRDAEGRLRRLNGVVEAGVFWSAADERLRVRTTERRVPGEEGEHGITLIAASPAALRAAGASVSSGRLYDDGHARRGDDVAVLGIGAARRLGITSAAGAPAVFVGDHALTVIGIIDDVARNPDFLLGLMVPVETAERLWGDQGAQRKILINTRLGAAQLIGSQAAMALRPQDPERLAVIVPPDPQTLRQGVEGDLGSLFLLLAGVSLLVGAVGIANTTLVSVMERTAEIGLRRALGARRHHIAGQFLIESSLLGSAGGLLGTCTGIIIVTGVSLARQWSAVMEPALVFSAPLIGTLTGLIAGVYPAVKAAGITPVQALNR
ncbi:ABC transporter permease [Spongiactinospora rosea]|uniref:ABC transporter permease n=1 Tax=Spongiactinospora rosea TaxID=2248750 RepID=A0A366LTX0_9ACTN|nr:ABC transporter permease [Spongiactinospora rosea]RBQ17030.1 ABC transporter permease [Spongiactinospora rosea]